MTRRLCWWLVAVLAVGSVAGPVVGDPAVGAGPGVDAVGGIVAAGGADATDVVDGVGGVDAAGEVDAVGGVGRRGTGRMGPVGGGVTGAVVPNASLDVAPSPAEPGETVTLDGSDSTADQGQIVGCDFDVDGDGTFDVFGEDDCIVSRQYDQTGQYEVAVRVRDGQQQTDVATATLVVAQNQPPDADFGWSPTAPDPGEEVGFDAEPSADADGEIVEYRWDFDGDGSVDAIRQVPTATREFAEPGTHPVTLEVVDDDGATDAVTRDVTVAADPVARCSVSETEVAPDERVTIDASGSDADLVLFDVDGDGTFDRTNDDDFTEVVEYAEPGSYTPVVRVQVGQQIDTRECPTVTVNQPPTAAFDPPPDPRAGSPATFDAGDSFDPDGTIVEYRWDFDDDGTFERNATDDVASHTFDEPGTRTVRLLVVDDDGAADLAVLQGIVVGDGPTPTATTATATRTATTTRTATAVPEPDATCTVSRTEVLPGEPVVVEVSGPELQLLAVDADGDGTYDERREENVPVTVRYEEPGTYDVSARVIDERQRTAVVDCGTVTVVERGGNRPPVAQLTHRPATVEPGESVVLDATGSDDPDGRIVVYRWDLDDDGDFDRETADATVSHAFDDPGPHTVRLVVQDDDGRTDEATDDVDVADEGLADLLLWVFLLGLGGAGGLVLCRMRPWFGGGGAAGGVTAYAAGTFELPVDGDPVAVSGLGFEPDLVALTASSAAATPDPDLLGDASVGWSYGFVHRADEERIAQQVVSVADDARRPDVAVAATRNGHALYLPSADGASVGGVAARVERTTEDGFELSVTGERPTDGAVAESTTGQVAAGAARGGTAVASVAGQLADDASVDWSVPDATVAREATEAVGRQATAGADAEQAAAEADAERATGEADAGQATAEVDAGQATGEADAGQATTEAAAGQVADPAGGRGGRPVVLFRAFETARPDDVDVGFFEAPTTPGPQSVDVPSGANHVHLTACTAVDEPDGTWTTGETVGLSTGDVVAGDHLLQSVTAGALTPSTMGARSTTAAAADEAIHLAYSTDPDAGGSRTGAAGSGQPATGPAGDGPQLPPVRAGGGRTVARATGLGDGLHLQYDEVHAAPDDAHPGGPPLVSYVAMVTGEGMVPATGYFAVPGPDEDGDVSVITGFEPGLVEFTVCAVDELGEGDPTVSPYPWGRSHGVAVRTADGVDQYHLHGAITPDGADLPEATTGGHLVGATAGTGLAMDGAAITGRDDLTVAAFTASGFEVRTIHVSTDERDPTAGSGKLVFYKAWPNPER